MNKNYFSLEVNKSNRLTRVFQLILGITCIILAIGWLIINYKTLSSNYALWLTILFLLGFGYFQINTGLGRGEKFIETGGDILKLKINSVLPVKEIKAGEILKTQIFPLSVIFFLKSGKKVTLRFGTTYTGYIDPARKAIEDFCSENNIESEIMKEEL
jgi:hypothetical protein